MGFFHSLHGDGQQHGADDEPHGTKTAKTAEDGDDQYEERSIDALLQEQGAQDVVHAGHGQRAPEGQAHGGHGGAGEPEGKTERAPDERRAHKGDGRHDRGQQPPEGRLLDARHGKADTAQDPLGDGHQDDAQHDALQGPADGQDETAQHGGRYVEDAGRDQVDAACVGGKDDRERHEEEQGPEDGHGAAQHVHAAVDEQAHGIGQHGIEVAEELRDHLVHFGIVRQAVAQLLEAHDPFGRQLEVVCLEFPQPGQTAGHLGRHQQHQGADGDDHSREDHDDIAVQRQAMGAGDHDVPQPARMAQAQTLAPVPDRAAHTPVDGQRQAGEASGHDDGDGVGAEQQEPGQCGKDVQEARQHVGHAGNL